MKKRSTKQVVVVGVDIGDKHSQVCGVDAGGAVVLERRVPTKAAGFKAVFWKLAPCRIVLEAGGMTRWVFELLSGMGHTVKVVNPRRMRRIYENESKSDVVDARELADAGLYRWGRLPEVHLRSREMQEKLSVLHARDTLVRGRVSLVNLVRSLLKQEGVMAPKCTPEAFPKRVAPLVPDGLAVAIAPLVAEIAAMTERVKELNRWIEGQAKQDTAVCCVQQVKGVGAIVGTAYVWTLEDADRFGKSRAVGSFVGLRPRRDQSGETDRQLPITKAGNPFLRRLLVGSAHYILGPFGPDTALRRWGLKLAERGGKRAKRKAVVAVARKLAVLLHHLWATGEVYEPFPAQQEAAA